MIATFRRRWRYGAALAAPWLLLAGGATAAPVQYDSFDTPVAPQVYVIGMLDPNPTIRQSAAPDMLGGQRDVWIKVAGTPEPFSALGTIGGGLLSFGSSQPGATMILQYDGIDLEGAGNLVNSYGLSNDLTAEGTQFGFLFRFQGLDSGPTADALEIEIDVTGPNGSAHYAGVIPDSGTPFEHYIQFAKFTAGNGTFDFDEATSVEITFNPLARQDVDFELEFFGTNVPEPGSAALTIVGLATGLWVARRRKTGWIRR